MDLHQKFTSDYYDAEVSHMTYDFGIIIKVSCRLILILFPSLETKILFYFLFSVSKI